MLLHRQGQPVQRGPCLHWTLHNSPMQVRSIALPRLQRVAEQGSVVVNDPRQGSSGAKEPGSTRGKGRDFQVRTDLSDQGKVPQLSYEWSRCWCDQLPGAACTCVAPC